MDNGLIKKIVFDLTLEIERLKLEIAHLEEDMEKVEKSNSFWFTEYRKVSNKLAAIENSKQEAIEPCTEQAEVTQAECFENMA